MAAYTFADPGLLTPLDPTTPYNSGYVANAALVTDPAEPQSTDRYYSAWWRHTATTTGVLSIDGGSSTVIAWVSIWTGATLGDLVRVSSAGDHQFAEAIIESGTVYHVRFIVEDPGFTGNYHLTAQVEAGSFAPPTNDAFATPAQVDISGSPYVSEPVSNRFLGLETGEPDLGYRSAWWRYTPTTSGTATIDTLAGDPIDTVLHVYTGAALTALTVVAMNDEGDAFGRSQITAMPVTADTTYLIRVSSYNSDFLADYVLTVAGPDTAPFDLTTIAPPATVQVDAPAPAEWINPLLVVTIPPAEAIVEAPAPDLIDATLTLVAPADGLVQPSKTPVFTVDVATDYRDVILEVEVGVDTTFVGAVAFTAPVPRGLLSNRINVQLDPTRMALENNNTYYWRARVYNAWDSIEWTAPQRFVVSAIDGDAVVAGGWIVDTTVVPSPHLWFTNPSAAKPGEASIVYGTTLRTPLTMTIAGAVADVVTVQQVPAAPEAYTDTRVISTGRISPAHSKITFVVPDVPGPGGVLYVDTH